MKRIAIETLLPGIFRRSISAGNPISGFLDVMEQLHAPVEAALEQLDATLNPRRTDERLVPFLARWVNLDRILKDEYGNDAGADHRLHVEPGRLRELTALAAHLSRWRGTCRGLTLFLRTATGIDGFEIDERAPAADGRPRPFHIRVRAPEAANAYRSLITRIIQVEKPAYVTYELVFEPAPDRKNEREINQKET